MDIRLCKASPTGDQEINDCTITIDIPIDIVAEDDWTLSQYRELYKEQAEAIMEVFSSLPGGTKHALLVLLLEEKASLLKVSDR